MYVKRVAYTTRFLDIPRSLPITVNTSTEILPQSRSQDLKKGGARVLENFDRKPHPLIMMSLLSLPEGVPTKNNNEKH